MNTLLGLCRRMCRRWQRWRPHAAAAAPYHHFGRRWRRCERRLAHHSGVDLLGVDDQRVLRGSRSNGLGSVSQNAKCARPNGLRCVTKCNQSIHTSVNSINSIAAKGLHLHLDRLVRWRHASELLADLRSKTDWGVQGGRRTWK